MFERFTDRARKVMALANQEAQRFNHEYVGTEHILLGVVKEQYCVAAKILAGFGVDARKTRCEVEASVRSGPPGEMPQGKLPQTLGAKAVLERAISEARGMGQGYVGTQHLLLGLLGVEGVGQRVLLQLGVDPGRARDAALEATLPADMAVPGEGGASPEPTVRDWRGTYVSVPLGKPLLARVREEAKRRTAETGQEMSEADVIRAVLEERLGKD